MKRAFLRTNKKNYLEEENNQYSVGDLDLINLRLNLPTDYPKQESHDKGSGDTYLSHKLHSHSHRKPTSNASPRRTLEQFSPGVSPSGYDRRRTLQRQSAEEIVFLYTKGEEKKVFTTEPVQEGDFLYPTTKKNHHFSSKLDSSRSNQNFPFKLTPSGNLKVESSQVVFSSKKLSVLVADPKNTKVNITPELTREIMANQEVPNFKKTVTNPMETIMSQAGGFSSLGSIIGTSPIRNPQKEGSEYESKRTSEILDPELNLNRLGYTSNEEINWEKVKLPEKQNLYLELYQRITNNTNADCKVYIDNEEFSCHLIVLQCYSELFDAYVAVKKVELPSDKCSVAAFGFIYGWMITGEPSYVHLDRQNVLDIFVSAKYLKIKDLVEQCWAFIDNMDVFNEDTAFLLYMDAKKRSLPEVKELMLPRIKAFFLILVSSQEWLDLEVEDVRNLLKSNYISINCEMEVFMSAVRWLKYDWQNRDKYKYEVLECVRFGNIAPWQLVDIKRNPENPDFMELAKDLRICKMIDDGLAFVIIKYWYGQENSDFQHWNTVLGLQEPATRNWTGLERSYLTFREFLIYLDQYRRNQLIEKNKPKVAEKGERKGREEKYLSQRSTPRVPTMEEFLAKRKSGGTKKVNKVVS
ncbi:uncharacterized protein LOC115891916 [Sitophilus oryzae]|uniref:Uncharacterized protein LOC115891916 n=1 Tax=Sitophilus oryzae TaxID=7048 RepID=A0A6J2YZY0_SITOR|nr:uncharacterized protein LOC115891916 [Sitophilus oryzae]